MFASAARHAVPRARSALSRSRGRLALLVVVLTICAFGSAGAASAATPVASTPAGKAWVRAAHLVPGLGAARIDLTPLAGGVAASVQMSPDASYGDVTAYQQFTPGSYVVTVRPRGSDLSTTAMLSRALTISAGKAYTLAALGSATAPRLATLSDDLTPPAADQARVRVLAAASSAPAVTVTAVGGPTIADDAVLGQATGYSAVPAGAWDLKTSWGSGSSMNSKITVASGSVYTLVVLDGAASPRLDLITDAAGAVSAPKGGAQTGGGGTATQFVDSGPSHASVSWGLAALVAVLGAGTVLAAARRRPARQ